MWSMAELCDLWQVHQTVTGKTGRPDLKTGGSGTTVGACVCARFPACLRLPPAVPFRTLNYIDIPCGKIARF